MITDPRQHAYELATARARAKARTILAGRNVRTESPGDTTTLNINVFPGSAGENIANSGGDIGCGT